MLIYYLIIMVCILTLVSMSKNVGSTLFYRKSPDSECWTEEDLAKLRVRMLFEKLAPKSIAANEVTPQYIDNILTYFKSTLSNIDSNTSPNTGIILKQVLADTYGGHLKSEILPAVRLSYYAGNVPYRDVKKLHDFYEELLSYLNTKGQGWREPKQLPKWPNVTVDKIYIGGGRLINACAYLRAKRDVDSCITIPIPQLDDEIKPTALYLPFRRNGLVSLTNPQGENLLLKYYTSASRCILQRSPRKCRHADFVTFNNDLWYWLKTNVATHLAEEKLYAVYGGILRVAAAVQEYGKGLSKKRMITQLFQPRKWYPWTYFRQASIEGIQTIWSSAFYIISVVFVSLGILLLQIGNTYLCPAYRYFLKSKKQDNDDSFVLNEGHTSAFSPTLNATPLNKNTFAAQTKPASVRSVKTQIVYDLNENKEKTIELDVSDSDNTDSDMSSSANDESETEKGKRNNSRQTVTNKAQSPPKIETTINQLRVNNTPQIVYRAETNSQPLGNSNLTEQGKPKSWWGSSSEASDSSSTKNRSQVKIFPRDLAWAKRVINKHCLKLAKQSKSVSGTEIERRSTSTTIHVPKRNQFYNW